ncbi:MAG: hypothetical protein M3R46_12225 [Actinomycetota bacterium]|nr:hypothetical protein [Actinomycetota bacterium]
MKVLHAALTAPLWVPGAVGLYTVSRGAHLAVKVKAKLRLEIETETVLHDALIKQLNGFLPAKDPVSAPFDEDVTTEGGESLLVHEEGRMLAPTRGFRLESR